MKYLKLISDAWQLIVLLLLIPLLWQSKPILGTNGLVESKIEFISSWYGWNPSKRITIQARKNDADKPWHVTQFEVEDALVVSHTSVPRMKWLMQSLDYAPWLTPIFPQRWTNQADVYDVVVRITPEQLEQLETARRAGYQISCFGGTFSQ